VAAIAAELGLKCLPWQRQVLAAALERKAGQPRYRDVVVSVPRQSGKSSLALSLILWRLLSAPDVRILYAAQTGARPGRSCCRRGGGGCSAMPL
jgi:phage terminase large subunit-like protein